MLHGEVDPKTHDSFTAAQTKILEGYDPSDILHHSKIAALDHANLPNGKANPYECTVNELKPFVLARGGSITSMLENQSMQQK